MTSQKFGGDWTAKKLNIFTSYLDAYLIALQNQKFKKIPSSKPITTMLSSCWSICMQKRWTAFTSTLPITREPRIGNIITIMWTALTLIAIANGCP